MINLLNCCGFRRQAPVVPSLVPTLVPPVPHAPSGAARPAVSGLAHLPPELWLLSASYLAAPHQASFFSAHPHDLLASDAAAASMAAAIRSTRDVALVSGFVAQAQGLPARQRARVLIDAVRWACRALFQSSCGPGDGVLHDVLEACLAQADSLPPNARNRVLSTLLLRLPTPYCDRQDFVPGRQGVFATRLITGLLAAARGGDALVCRAVARSARGLVRLIDLEYGVAPGLGHHAERAARAAEFLEVLGRAETVACGNVGAALETAASLVSYFFAERMESHLPLLRRLVSAPGNTSNCLGLQYLAEIVDRVADPAERTKLMCEMFASMKAGAEREGPTAVRDAVGYLAILLRRPMEALDADQRASVHAALETAGHRSVPH